MTSLDWALGIRVLTHRYRYYVLGEPVLSDFEYDWLEKHYISLCRQTNTECYVDNLVGFSETDPRCQIAKHLVDTKQDHYSLWLETMEPVWRRLGPLNYTRYGITLPLMIKNIPIRV